MGVVNSGNPVASGLKFVVALLMAIGTVVVFSASTNLPREMEFGRFYDYPALRQLLFFPLAMVVLCVVSRVDYRRWGLRAGWARSPIVYLMALASLLTVLVLFPMFGTEVNRARRWLRIGLDPVTLSFQPSELAKWALIFFVAAYCERIGGQIREYRRGFLPVLLLAAVIAGLILLEDFGTAAFIMAVVMTMLMAAGAKFSHLLSPLPVLLPAFLLVLIRSPGRVKRLLAFLEPEKWAQSAAYQANQSLIALASGGLWGKGLGRGICKYGHLPEDTTDFVFAILGEELGFAGAIVVIGLFAAFVWLGLLAAARCKDRFGRLLAAGIVLAVGLQAAINMAVVTVLLPTKGIPLPFVSAGGTSMLLSAAAVGVLVSIAERGPAAGPEGNEPDD